jgi:hypothetical protein
LAQYHDEQIIFTLHARKRMLLRGATEEEVVLTITGGTRESAKRGKWHAVQRFDFGHPSPINAVVYRCKTVDVVFSAEPAGLVVLTVKVYYHNQ